MKTQYLSICALVFGCFQVHAAAPANASFEGREYIELAHGPAVLDGVVTHATTEPFEPGSGYHSIWWEVVAPEDGILKIETQFNSWYHLEVYEGSDLTLLRAIRQIHFMNFERRNTWVTAARGTRLIIRAATSSSGVTGSISVGLLFDSTAPISFVPLTERTSHDNDKLANYQVLHGFEASGSGFITSAGTEPFESGTKTLWWGWIAPASGILTLTTEGSNDFSQSLQVWIGDQMTELQPVRLSLSRAYPSLSFPVVAGQEYKFRIDASSASAVGTAVINLNLDTSVEPIASSLFRALPTANNGSFANRTVLTGTNLSSLVYTRPVAESNEAFEKGRGGRSCWWEWTVPKTGTYSISTQGSDTNNKYLAVFHGDRFQDLEFLVPESSSTGFPSRTFAAEAGMRLFIRSAYSSSVNSGHILLTITGEDDGESPTITNWMHANAQVGEGFYFRIQARNQPDSYAAFGLPAGLTLNTATGEITGRPEYAGTFPVSLVARKGAMESTAVLRLTVAPAAATMVDAITPLFSGYIYTIDMGWVYTNWRTYPYVYDFERGTWLYYVDGTANPRRFWNLFTQLVEEMP